MTDRAAVMSNYRMQLPGRGRRVSQRWHNLLSQGKFWGARRALQLMLGR